MTSIVVIAHNIRSTFNIGSLLRTAEGLGVEHVYCSGYTPYPKQKGDERLPHQSKKITEHIHKTALGAELSQPNSAIKDLDELIVTLRHNGYEIVGLEQSDTSIDLPSFRPSEKVALILGNEVTGMEPEVMRMCDKLLEIPMFGSKESFNVVQAAAMTLYHCRFMSGN